MNDNFSKKIFGLRLKELRKTKGLTQDNVCEKANLDVSNYSKMETGQVTPSMHSLYKIIKGAGFEPNELFEFEHLKDEKSLDKEINNIYKNYPLSKKQFLYRFMKMLEDMKF